MVVLGLKRNFMWYMKIKGKLCKKKKSDFGNQLTYQIDLSKEETCLYLESTKINGTLSNNAPNSQN